MGVFLVSRQSAFCSELLYSRRFPCPAQFPFPSATRFFQCWRQQVDLREIAARFQLSPKTVRRLLARFEQEGEGGVMPHYDQCGRPQAIASELVEEVCRTRREHPRWGAEMIRLELAEHHPTLPCARTMQRRLRQAGLHPAPAGRPSAERPRVPRATRPHQGWQTDASEELRLAGRQQACWLRIVDECSGAFLSTTVFAAGRWEHVARHAIQEQLRQAFACWGLPERLRVDNGYPWGSLGDFPTEMALWLIGLGIDVLWITAGCPQENGVVERGQGTGKNWAEPQTCRDAAQLQQRCDAMDRRQRERYPYRKGRSRWEVYPELKHSGRSYSRRGERRHWDLERVLTFLAEQVAKRKVDGTGSITLYHRTRYVGKPYIGSHVYVTLDPTGPTWVITDEHGTQLRTHAADELTEERICALDVSCRKGARARRHPR